MNNIEMLKNVFLKLANSLEPLNTWYRDYPAHLKKQFDKICLETNEENKFKKVENLIAYLEKLANNPKIKNLNDREILEAIISDVSNYNDNKETKSISLDENLTIIENLKNILKVFTSKEEEQKDNKIDDSSKKIETVDDSATVNKQEELEEEFVPEKDVQEIEVPTAFKVENTTLKASKNIKKEIKTVKETIKSNSHISITSPEISNLSDKNKNIAYSIIDLKFMLKEKEYFEATNATNKLRALLECYCSLCSKAELSDEEELMLQLLKKYKPLEILRKFINKYEKKINCDNILSEINNEMTLKLDKLLEYNSQTKNTYFNNESAIESRVLRITQLMNIEEIVSLYKKYSSSLLNKDLENMKILQDIFASAIRNNPNYAFFVNLPNTEGNEYIEKIIICAKYFREFKVDYEKISDIETFIKSQASHPLLAEIAINYLNTMYSELQSLQSNID